MGSNKLRIQYDDICAIINTELYRYHTINDKLIKSLSDNYLWFSDPNDFNDPYDCNLEFDFENTHGEIETYFREVNNLPECAHLKLNEDQLQLQIQQCVSKPELLKESFRKLRTDKIKAKGVCCFSERDDKLLMWSHYADKHKGVCLSFDINEDKQLFSSILYAVEYPPTYPKINAIREREFLPKAVRFIFATKSSEWSYEEEVRIIRDDTNPPYRDAVKFNKKSLKAIKFGYKSTIDDQLKIIDTLYNAGGYDHVRFYLAKLKKFDFGIEYEEIFQ